ncbi:MAG: hypothetical protein JWP10_329 [Nocardioidaceae bacterium]|nr:hypothetical protein [Nocardioidaceae bacterium]
MTRRLEGVDLARFVALAGMMLVHLGPIELNPFALPPWSEVIAGGRAATLFAVLAGVSISLVTRYSPRGSGSPCALALRAILLFLLGMVLGSISGIGIYVILCYYAVLFMIAIPLRHLQARTLLLLAFGWAIVAPVVSILIRRHLGISDFSQVDYADLGHPGRLVSQLLIVGTYPCGIWVAYLLLGLGLGKLDLRQPVVARAITVVGAIMVALTLIIAKAFLDSGVVDPIVGQEMGWPALFMIPNGNFPADTWTSLAALGIHSSTPLNILTSMGSALFVIGASLMLMGSASPRTRLATFPLRAAGQMTLTLYTAHALLVWARFDKGWHFTDGFYSEWLAQLALLTFVATVWMSIFKRGPIEAAIHGLTKRLPKRKKAPERVPTLTC